MWWRACLESEGHHAALELLLGDLAVIVGIHAVKHACRETLREFRCANEPVFVRIPGVKWGGSVLGVDDLGGENANKENVGDGFHGFAG